jgi:hypothetical protein
MALNFGQLLAAPASGLLGGVKAGAGITIAVDGTISASTPGFGLSISGTAAKVSITQQTNVPPVGAGLNQAIVGSLYWDNTIGAFFIYYNDGDSSQWTQATPSQSGGGASIPAGTLLSFPQAAAPTGWTQVATFDDASIRLIGAAGGGGTGGSIGFTTLFSSTATYAGSINITSGSVGDTALSTAQLASHNHVTGSYNGGGCGGGSNPAYSLIMDYPGEVQNKSVSSSGSNAVHTHSLVGAAAAGNFTSNFAVKYVNFITCSKN